MKKHESSLRNSERSLHYLAGVNVTYDGVKSLTHCRAKAPPGFGPTSVCQRDVYPHHVTTHRETRDLAPAWSLTR
ncbi:hypothetical protein BO443_210089 [Burkholderia orbicola]